MIGALEEEEKKHRVKNTQREDLKMYGRSHVRTEAERQVVCL
jgi:hypothetical protein